MTASPSTPIDQRLLFGLIVALALAYAAISVLSTGAGAIHEDMVEAYVWGGHFELGYYKHPPLWAWIAGGWFRLLPRTAWAFALLCAINVATGLWGAWLVIGRFAEGEKRLAAFLLLLITPFYAFPAFVFNANAIFISLWPWTAYAFVRAIDERKLTWAVAFGLLAGADMLSKYYAVVLLGSCFLAALAHPKAKAYFTSPSPYLSVLVGAIVFAPHVWWLIQTGFLPFSYFHGETGHGLGYSAGTAVKLVAGDLAFLAVVIILVLVSARAGLRRIRTGTTAIATDPRLRLVAVLTIAPLALTVIFGLVFRLKLSTNWTIAIFPLAPLLVVEVADPPRLGRLARIAFGLGLLLAVAGLAAAPFVPALSHAAKDIQPRREVARAADALWAARSAAPMPVVGGDDTYAEATAFYSTSRPAIFIHFDPRLSPWIDVGDLTRSGLVAVCPATDLDCVAGAVRYSTPLTVWSRLTLAHDVGRRAGPPQAFIIGVTPPSPPQR